jgi:hypothetical protein
VLDRFYVVSKFFTPNIPGFSFWDAHTLDILFVHSISVKPGFQFFPGNQHQCNFRSEQLPAYLARNNLYSTHKRHPDYWNYWNVFHYKQ